MQQSISVSVRSLASDEAMPPLIAMRYESFVNTLLLAELFVYPPIRFIKGYWNRLKNRYNNYAPLVDVEERNEASENLPHQQESKSPHFVGVTKRVLRLVSFAAFASFYVLHHL